MHNLFQRIAVLTCLAGSICTALAADLVVVGNPAAAPMTKEQVADLFLGKSQAMTPLDQPEAAALRTDFYKRATGRDVPQVKAVWSRLVFSGKGQAPKELTDSAAVKKAVAADPKSVGYIERSAVDGSVKVLMPVE